MREIIKIIIVEDDADFAYLIQTTKEFLQKEILHYYLQQKTSQFPAQFEDA